MIINFMLKFAKILIAKQKRLTIKIQMKLKTECLRN